MVETSSLLNCQLEKSGSGVRIPYLLPNHRPCSLGERSGNDRLVKRLRGIPAIERFKPSTDVSCWSPYKVRGVNSRVKDSLPFQPMTCAYRSWTSKSKHVATCGVGIVFVLPPSKRATRVRFPYTAPIVRMF